MKRKSLKTDKISLNFNYNKKKLKQFIISYDCDSISYLIQYFKDCTWNFLKADFEQSWTQ